MGTLKTLGWTTHNGQKRMRELVIPLEKILYTQEYVGQDKDERGDTCLVALTEQGSLHVDIPLSEMRKILDQHRKNPNKNFDTHLPPRPKRKKQHDNEHKPKPSPK